MKRNSGYAALTRAISGGQYSSSGGVPAPGAGEDLVAHQHRHVAAQPVALARQVEQRVADRLPQRRRERVELDDVRPRREVRVAPARHPARADLHRPDRIAGIARHEQLRPPRSPRMVRRDVVGDVVEDQLQPQLGQRGPRRGERRRPAEPRVHDVVAHAVRRADDVRVAQVGQRGAVARLQPRIGPRDRQPRRAALPHAHQPDRLDARQRDRLPGHLVQPPPRQPDRGVDLVDHDRSAPSISYSSATVPVQPVWWLAPIPAPLSPWKYSWKRIRSRQCGSVWNFSIAP